MSRRRIIANTGTHALLWAGCALMAALLVSDCATFFQYAGLWAASSSQLLDYERVLLGIDALVNLLCVVLEVSCIVRAVQVVRLHEQDTHDHVAASQLAAIALMGVAVVEWSVAAMVDGSFEPADFLALAASLVPCFFYYAAVGRESHSPFWRGIRNAEPGQQPLSADGLPAELALDTATGFLVGVSAAAPAGSPVTVPAPRSSGTATQVPPDAASAAPSPAVCATICTTAEFARDHAGSNTVPRSQRSLESARRTAVYPLGDAVTGTVFMPEEKIDMTGPALGGEAHLGFYLQKDHIVLIADDEPTRRLLAWYLRNQYLAKKHPGEALIELQELLIGDDPEALANLDDRIDLLEDSLSEGVNEVPRDFSDYVNETRHDLGVLQKFYRQVADAAEDALADGVLVDKRTKHLLAGLSRRASTLAGDASELRDYLNQVREGYQERVNVRQNGIVSILTIVTALATPVALITGWYGMNFKNMPELKASGAYNVVIIVAVTVVTLEVLYFKRRRWF